MSERNFWVLIRNSLPIEMYRVENKVSKGMPDIHYVNEAKSGWIELKYLPKWPKKRISSGLMLNQSLWLENYSKNQGQAWVLIRIGRDFVALIDGSKAEKLYNRPCIKDFLNMLPWSRKGNLSKEDWEELAGIIAS